MDHLFTGSTFLIKKKFLKLLGADFRIYNSEEREILFAHLKAFKWKEDITLYSDESKTNAVIGIKARKILDFSSAYDFMDLKENKKIGAAKRKGFKSLFRDEWIVMDIDDREIGIIREDNAWLAFFRRFISNLWPQTFHVTIGEERVVKYKNNFNPFVSKVAVTMEKEHPLFPAKLAVVMGLLLCAVEGKQQ